MGRDSGTSSGQPGQGKHDFAGTGITATDDTLHYKEGHHCGAIIEQRFAFHDDLQGFRCAEFFEEEDLDAAASCAKLERLHVGQPHAGEVYLAPES